MQRNYMLLGGNREAVLSAVHRIAAHTPASPSPKSRSNAAQTSAISVAWDTTGMSRRHPSASSTSRQNEGSRPRPRLLTQCDTTATGDFWRRSVQHLAGSCPSPPTRSEAKVSDYSKRTLAGHVATSLSAAPRASRSPCSPVESPQSISVPGCRGERSNVDLEESICNRELHRYCYGAPAFIGGCGMLGTRSRPERTRKWFSFIAMLRASEPRVEG